MKKQGNAFNFSSDQQNLNNNMIKYPFDICLKVLNSEVKELVSQIKQKLDRSSYQ